MYTPSLEPLEPTKMTISLTHPNLRMSTLQHHPESSSGGTNILGQDPYPESPIHVSRRTRHRVPQETPNRNRVLLIKSKKDFSHTLCLIASLWRDVWACSEIGTPRNLWSQIRLVGKKQSSLFSMFHNNEYFEPFTCFYVGEFNC